MKFKLKFIFLLICSLLLITSCVETTDVAISGNYTIELNDTEITTTSTTAIIDGSVITLTTHGNYTISGTLTDGQIIVNAPKEDVNLIFNNIDITCSTSAPIYIITAGDMIITVPEGTTNKVTDGSSYKYANAGDTEPDATIFSKDDLILKGNGLLTIKANYNNGLSSNDSLTIDGCNIVVDAKNNGIRGKDYLIIQNSEIDVTAKNDGIKSTNETEEDMGYIILTDNIISIKAVDEGISAINDITISGGSLYIDTQNNGMKTNTTIDIKSGTVTIKTLDDDFMAATVTGTSEAKVTVNGSTYNF